MAETNTTKTEPEKTEEPLGEGGVKALKAERDARKQAERQVQELTEKLDATTNDLEDKLAEATKQGKTTSAQLSRMNVAYEQGVPADLIGYLQGETAEELAESAKTLMGHLSANKAEPEPKTPGPRPDLTQGKAPGASGPALNSPQLTAALAKAVGVTLSE